MKRLFFTIIAVALTVFAVQAQRLVIGEKAPAVQVNDWIGRDAPMTSGKPTLVDFFHSANRQCVDNLPKLNALKNTYGAKIEVVVIARETKDKIEPLLNGKGYAFSFGLDEDGKTFGAYHVRYVPFAVLLDGRGRLVWTGNVAGLTDAIIQKAMK